ncbi:pheromone A receptor-domain-containing protein [Aspergillus desertorum]
MDSPNMSPSSQTVVMQTLSVIAVVVTTPPLILHWKNRNFPAAVMMGWLILLNLFNVINAFIWPTDDVNNWWDGAGLCDIEVKMLISSYVAIPGSLVCIFRSLACVLDTSRATLIPSKCQRWTTRFMQVLFCVVVPLLAAATHLVYQGDRYFIFAVSGCVSSLDQSWVSLALGYIWPLVVCFIASYYCGLLLFRLRRYRNQFNEILRAANSGLSRSRFLRLFFLAFIMLLALIPLQAYIVYVQIKVSMPWHPFSWSLLRGYESSWGVIERIPTGGTVYFDRWIPIASGYTAFAFFGTGRDASRVYRSLLQPFGLDCCFSPIVSTTSGSFPHTSGSGGSRAHLVPGGPKARNDLYHSARTNSTDYTCRSSAGYEDRDLEKGTRTFRVAENQVISEKGWLKTHFAWLGNPLSVSFSTSARRDRTRPRSAPHLAVPPSSNTVCTNAWAGSSQSRGSMDLGELSESLSPGTDFIRVKQVIRQERELQV